MRLTIAGSGDAFGSGGRHHTSFRLDAGGHTLCVDFGASALNGWASAGLDTRDIDAVVLSHLHGDHFGGLPFLLLQSQFVLARTKPLRIAGPVGLRARLETALEAFFPGMLGLRWGFDWDVEEHPPGESYHLAGFDIASTEVIHPCGAPPTALRIAAGGKTFAYSGDTAWTDALLPIARDADLLMIECYAGEKPTPNHIDWPTLRANLPRLRAKRICVTHMSASALAKTGEMEQAGLVIAEDGKILDL